MKMYYYYFLNPKNNGWYKQKYIRYIQGNPVVKIKKFRLFTIYEWDIQQYIKKISDNCESKYHNIYRKKLGEKLLIPAQIELILRWCDVRRDVFISHNTDGTYSFRLSVNNVPNSYVTSIDNLIERGIRVNEEHS